MDNNEIKKMLALAHAGDDDAYKALRRGIHGDLIDHLIGEHHFILSQAEDFAETIWDECGALVLRLPAEGGFNPHKKPFVRFLAEDCGGLKWTKEIPLNEEAVASPHPHGGTDRPDRLLVDRHKYLLLLFLIFQKKIGRPHQQLAFVLTAVVYGKRTPRGLDGKPGEVHRLHADTPLRQLLEIIRDDFLGVPACRQQPSESADSFDFATAPLRERLTVVQNTCFRDYYTNPKDDKAGTAAITRWTSEVRNKLKKSLARSWSSFRGMNWTELENMALEQARKKKQWWQWFRDLW